MSRAQHSVAAKGRRAASPHASNVSVGELVRAERVLELQRTVGNRAVQWLIMHGEYEATKVSPSPRTFKDEL